MTTASENARPLADAIEAAPARSDGLGAPVLPRPVEAARALDEAWLDGVADPAVRDAWRAACAGRPRLAALLVGLFAHSSFLSALLRRTPEAALDLLLAAPDASLARLLAELAATPAAAVDEADAMRRIRRARNRAALLVALADLGGVWDHGAVVSALTAFADEAVRAALRVALRDAARAGHLRVADGADLDARLEAASGLVVLALGKHGAGELNYSSDVDLVLFSERARAALADGVDAHGFYLRLAKRLVKLLQERTADGFALRVDLRLRPDPGSTPPVVTLDAARSYYETVGQNWERAAFIKARAFCGDVDAAHGFLRELAPFTWRKYFDFAAIADVHAMKRQIHVARGHEAIAVAGHDIKLGRGGIREIEFFVQTQQLVFGGRRPQLRGPATLPMLAALDADGWITAEARDELSAAYVFLRGVEHRLQMVADEQTQRLPADADELERFARFCGFADAGRFGECLVQHARRVEAHYARLFEEAPALTGGGSGGGAGNLVFTGADDDPDTLDTLRALGFRAPAAVAEIVRGWHFGRRPALRSARAREVLTELAPALLAAFGRSTEPDAALRALDQALERLPAAVELFSILRSKPALLDLFADVMGGAPGLAQIVATRPHVLDALIDPAFAAPPAGASDAVGARLRGQLADADHLEAFSDRVRDAVTRERFLIGARLLSGLVRPRDAGRSAAILADSVLERTLEAVVADFAAAHGRVPGLRTALLGYGRLGSRDLTATSDLDLVFVYDVEPGRMSDGARPLDAVTWANRVAQRLVSALTLRTRHGSLYDVDLRLRPHGGKSPVATQAASLRHYFEAAGGAFGGGAADAGRAELWELMALSRARPVAGDEALCRELADLRRTVLARPRNAAETLADVAKLRRLVHNEKGRDDPLDTKVAWGGLLHVEFLAQGLAVAEAARCGAVDPDLLSTEPEVVLTAAARTGLLPAGDARALSAAFELINDALHWQRLLGARGEADGDEDGAAARLARALGQPTVAQLRARLAEVQAEVADIFERRVGPVPTAERGRV